LPEWYETFFDALAMDVWRALVPAEASDAEARFLSDTLAPEGPARLLDVPCGDGRLALRLAAMGHQVVGVDLSTAAIDRLRGSDRNGTVDAHVGDLRALGEALDREPLFDGAFCMGNSFGYFDDPATDRFVAGVAAALRPGGRFVVDAPIVAEAVLPGFQPGDRHAVGHVVLEMANDYDIRASTMVSTMRLTVGERSDTRVVRHRVLTCRELVRTLERGGFAVEAIVGDVDGSAFALGAPRCLFVGMRI
jgi:predicted TPR repeat methyltransferase